MDDRTACEETGQEKHKILEESVYKLDILVAKLIDLDRRISSHSDQGQTERPCHPDCSLAEGLATFHIHIDGYRDEAMDIINKIEGKLF